MGTTQLPAVPVAGLQTVCALMDTVPGVSFAALLRLVYPFEAMVSPQTAQLVQTTLDKFDLAGTARGSGGGGGGGGQAAALPAITAGAEPGTAFADFPGSFSAGGEAAPLPLLTGEGAFRSIDQLEMVGTGYQLGVLNRMIASHTAADMCLIGSAGVGKTVLVNEFARLLGYSIQPVLLHKDMTARDLLQQRSTKPNGDTVWK